MYEATVVSVMLAAPSDVVDELRATHDAIAEWNSLHSRTMSAVAMPLHWSTDSTPGLGAPAQSLINEQLLPLSDMLIAVFWTRLGSPTDDYASGTVEEIERHAAAGKPVVVFFSDRSIAPSEMETAHYQGVLAFKKSLKDGGLYDTFRDGPEFAIKIRRHLTRRLQELIARRGSPATPSRAEPGSAQAANLSPEAERLLLNASEDPHGVVLVSQTLGGTQVQTNGVEFAEVGVRRSEATWLAAVDELGRLGLIEGSTRGISQVTASGYSAADARRPAARPLAVPRGGFLSAPDVRTEYWSKSHSGVGAGLVVHNIGTDVALDLEGQRLMPTGAFETSRALSSLNPGERGAFSSDWNRASIPAGAPTDVPDGKYLTRVLYHDRSGKRSESPWTVTDKRD